ncbi:MAG: glycosyltransferase [Chloroflexi bacterium]|nr:glycosyltransferase [Chloroflexota bacterium]
MRIFYASDTTPNSAFESDLWRNNLYLPLVDLGHNVVEFQYDLRETFKNLDPAVPEQKAFIDRNRPKLTKELMRQVKKAHAAKPVDVLFSYFYDACVLPEAIDEIKCMGIKTVNWYCNGSYQLHLVSEISRHYDWCLVPEKFRLKDYVAMGARPIYCQEAANPNIYKAYDLPVEFDVTFVGQAYGDRPAFIKYLLEQGIDVRAWGWGWQRFSSEPRPVRRCRPARRALEIRRALQTREGWHALKERICHLAGGKAACTSPSGDKEEHITLPSRIIGDTLSDAEMIWMYSRSKINLGFSSCGNTHETGERILQVRLRDFEVPMSGGFYMVEYMSELEEFFDIGKEIVCYSSKEDLAEKISYYLKHDDERERIRKAGHERCLRDHTWHKRFRMAFRKMGLE